MAPSLILARQERLASSGDPAVLWCITQKHFEATTRRVQHILVKTSQGRSVTTPSLSREYWYGRLTETYDGASLKEARRVGEAHGWIRNASNAIPGDSWIRAMAVRSGSAYTRARAARGRSEAPLTKCQGHCGAQETIAHILQQCSKTHGARIERHDQIVSRLGGRLEQLGYSVQLEPIVPSGCRYLKPDIICQVEKIHANGQRESSIHVLDVQVVATANIMPLRHRYLQKVEKYSGPDVVAYCSSHVPPGSRLKLEVHGITVTWNGVVAKESATAMLRLGLTLNDIRKVAADAVFGSGRILAVYRRATLRTTSDYNDSLVQTPERPRGNRLGEFNGAAQPEV